MERNLLHFRVRLKRRGMIMQAAALLFAAFSAFTCPVYGAGADPVSEAYAFTVTGRVTSDQGDPLPGVSVLEKGTTNGTVTDTEGRYSLTVTDENVTLVFSFIGYT